jgi:hypothetical protein
MTHMVHLILIYSIFIHWPFKRTQQWCYNSWWSVKSLSKDLLANKAEEMKHPSGPKSRLSHGFDRVGALHFRVESDFNMNIVLELAMSLAKVVNIGSQVKWDGLVMEGQKFPTVLMPKQNSVCSLKKDCRTIHLSVLVHECMFVHKSDSACG